MLGQAVGQRQGQVPHERQVQLGDRARDDLAGRGSLRGDVDQGHARDGQVRDFKRKKTVTVKAGHSYLARAQRAASKAKRR